MSIEYESDRLDELVRLARENHKMLKAMRRSAWLSGLFKLVLWVAVLVLPLWLYMQYLAPVMQGLLESYQELQGTSAKAQAQFGQLNEYLRQLQNFTGGNTQ